MADEKKYYCGIGPVPRGQERGSVAYCVRNNQVRYYGLVAIDESMIGKYKGSSNDLQKEQIKMKKLENDAVGIIREGKNIKFAMEQDDISEKKLKGYEKKLEDLRAKRDKLKIKMKKQRTIIDAMVKDKKKEDKRKLKNEKEKEKEKETKSKSKDSQKSKNSKKSSKK